MRGPAGGACGGGGGTATSVADGQRIGSGLPLPNDAPAHTLGDASFPGDGVHGFTPRPAGERGPSPPVHNDGAEPGGGSILPPPGPDAGRTPPREGGATDGALEPALHGKLGAADPTAPGRI